jgi:hypothetical protein
MQGCVTQVMVAYHSLEGKAEGLDFYYIKSNEDHLRYEVALLKILTQLSAPSNSTQTKQ